ncbi:MAG: ABC transporter substrate-binding protein [Clostridia bacterium]|nr:ABC transporter substrate-binding protein [Clostridia bacterium]MBR0407339.1 ABC transporter substrate-binding protein [Clostridia bacterium]
MKKLFALALALILALSLLPAAFAEENVLRYGVDADAAGGFDPHTISAVASMRMIGQMYNTLVDVDENLNVIPELATSWEQPDDTTYIFHLAENVTFHSGRKMTAEDVKYSFDRILDPATGALGNSSSYAGDIDTVEVVDDYTVKITLKNINAPFLANLSSSYCSIVDKDVVEANDGSLLLADGGTGPYTLGDWVPDNSITVKAYPDYFDEAGKATFDAIEFYVLTDASARLAALRTGAVDLIVADTAMLDLVENDANIQTISYQSRNYTGLFLNPNRAPFDNVKVRQAINLALNREEIIEFAFNGKALVSGFVPASLGHWAVDVTGNEYYTQNIEKAKALLAEAGYPNGFETNIIVGLLDSIRDTGLVVEQQLSEIGIKVNVQDVERGQYLDAWNGHDFDIMVCQNGAGSDPSRAVAFFFKTGSSANIQDYSNARVDELCELAVATSDTAKREEYYKEAINIILDDCVVAIVASPQEYFLASTALQGFAPNASNANNFAGVTLAK